MSKQRVYVVRYRHCTGIVYSSLVGIGDSMESALALARREYISTSVLREPRESNISSSKVGEWLLEIGDAQYHIEGMEVQNE